MGKLKIVFTPTQRGLVLKYGYPLDEIENQLESNQGSLSDIVIGAGVYEWEHLAGELARSLNHDEVTDDSEFEAVNEIADIIEMELERLAL